MKPAQPDDSDPAALESDDRGPAYTGGRPVRREVRHDERPPSPRARRAAAAPEQPDPEVTRFVWDESGALRADRHHPDPRPPPDLPANTEQVGRLQVTHGGELPRWASRLAPGQEGVKDAPQPRPERGSLSMTTTPGAELPTWARPKTPQE